MKDQLPIRTARRRILRQDRERQGLAVSPCVLCIESHHTAGKHHDPHLTASLCQKHHRQMHEELLRAGVPLTLERDKAKRVAKALRAIAIYDRARADAMERWADTLDQ